MSGLLLVRICSVSSLLLVRICSVSGLLSVRIWSVSGLLLVRIWSVPSLMLVRIWPASVFFSVRIWSGSGLLLVRIRSLACLSLVRIWSVSALMMCAFGHCLSLVHILVSVWTLSCLMLVRISSALNFDQCLISCWCTFRQCLGLLLGSTFSISDLTQPYFEHLTYGSLKLTLFCEHLFLTSLFCITTNVYKSGLAKCMILLHSHTVEICKIYYSLTDNLGANPALAQRHLPTARERRPMTCHALAQSGTLAPCGGAASGSAGGIREERKTSTWGI